MHNVRLVGSVAYVSNLQRLIKRLPSCCLVMKHPGSVICIYVFKGWMITANRYAIHGSDITGIVIVVNKAKLNQLVRTDDLRAYLEYPTEAKARAFVQASRHDFIMVRHAERVNPWVLYLDLRSC